MSQFHENQKDTLTYKDSWLQNTVELAALGTILTGAGTMAAKGDFTGVMTGVGKDVGKHALNMGARYLQRGNNQGAKSLFQIAKKTTSKLNKMDIPEGKTFGEVAVNESIRKLKATTEAVKRDKRAMDRIKNEAAKRLNRAKMDHPNMHERDIMKMLEDQEIQNEVKRREGIIPQPFKQKKKKNDQQKMSMKDRANQMFATGLTGVVFGAGITGAHALDRVLSNQDVQTKVEDSFEYAGSFLNRKDREKMDKKAGSLELYNALTSIGRKTPEAVASGLGFTGVSLGTAKYLNAQQEKKEELKPKGTRVIIELGDEEVNDPHNRATPPASPYSMLPKFATAKNSGDLTKLANRGRNFLNDLMGHGGEINRLNQVNPADVAAEKLKGQNVEELVKQKYGNLVNDPSDQLFRGRLFDSETAQAKQEIAQQIEELERRKARARLLAGGGTLGVGGASLGLASLMKPAKPENAEPNNSI